jgi:hypothetical protein
VSITTYASQIESNHSYFKNSNFLSDYEITVKGYGDIKYRNYEFEKTRTNSINTDLAINFDIQGKIEEGFKYGIQWTERFNNEFEKSRTFFGYISDSYYGRFEFGNTLAATEVSRIGGDSISIGNGGVFGELSRYMVSNLSGGSYLILKEGSLSSQMFGYYNADMNMKYFDYFNYKEKINYYSPDFFGFQMLFSFMPNNALDIKYVDINTTSTGNLLLGDIVSIGFNYANTFDNIGIALSVISERNLDLLPNRDSSGQKIERDIDISSDILGVNINYFSFTVGASLGILRKGKTTNNTFKNIIFDRTEYKNYTVSYEFRNIILNYNLFESEVKEKNKFSSSTMALELKLAKNVSLYGEYTDFSVETLDILQTETKGKLFLFGALINFY